MLIFKAVLICISILVAAEILGTGLFPAISSKSTLLSMPLGMVVMWALFYVICLPAVFLQTQEHGMDYVEWIYSGLLGILILISLALFAGRLIKRKKPVSTKNVPLSRSEIIYLSLFLALVLFQLIKAVFYSYSDGDDAYYIAVAQSLGSGANGLFVSDPYTGELFEVTYRYALAPFSAWVAYFARVFDLNAAIVAHVCMPVVMIIITYVIYNAIADRLFTDNKCKKYMFLCLLAVFVMFAHYSYNSAEVFLLTRSRQGKEALANVIAPLLLLEIINVADEKEWKLSPNNLILIILIDISGALTSVFGNLLVLIVLFGNLIYSFIRKAAWKERIKAALLAIPNLLVIGIYVML